MNVTLEKKDELNALISIQIEKSDYQETLDQQLKDYRKKVNLPGFRRGHVPMGMVKQMVGKSLLYEEVNKLTSNKLFEYLREHQIDILGQPLASEERESELDFDNYGDFVFHFDLGLAPKFDLKLSDKDKLTRYAIEVDEKEVEQEIKNLRRQNGKLETVEVTETENDSIVALMTEVDKKGEHIDGGVFEQEVTVLPEIIKDKKIKKQLVPIKTGDELIVDPFKLFNENEMVMAQSLGIDKDKVKGASKTFKFKVKEIKRVIPAELDENFFTSVFGAGVASSEEEFRIKISENLGMYYASESEKQLEAELNALVKDKHNLALPDAFLKRWLMETKPENYTAENIEERYAEESDILRKQLVREKVAADNNIEVSAEEIDETSFAYTAQMLRQYGLNDPDPQLVRSFEARNRDDKDYILRIRDVVIEKKVLDVMKGMVSIKEKKIAIDKFYEEVKKFSGKQN